MHRKTETLKKSERIKKRLLFNRLFREGRYFSAGGGSDDSGKSANFSLRILYNKLNISRLGISLPKRVFPKATQRNRVKRLIREVFRKNKGYLGAGFDILIRPKKFEILELGYKEIEKEVLGLFKEAEVASSRRWRDSQ